MNAHQVPEMPLRHLMAIQQMDAPCLPITCSLGRSCLFIFAAFA
jgi:hypothetical protein